MGMCPELRVKRYQGINREVRPDWAGLVNNILRRGTPDRVFLAELFLDEEVKDAIGARFDLLPGIEPSHPYYRSKLHVAVQRFLGYDYVSVGLVGAEPEWFRGVADDTAQLARTGGRGWNDEHHGPIRSWQDFERFPWPQVSSAAAASLEWYSRYVPEDMCLIGWGGFGNLAEWLSNAFGYESLCLALHDERDLVRAVADRILESSRAALQVVLEFDRVKMIWASDDMGFKTQTLLSPPDMRELVLEGHKELAAMSHAAGRPYLLHTCGNVSQIIDDLVDDVHIDGKHSFEDTIEDVRAAKLSYGRRVALLGGIDVDFLCRADESAIRKRVRDTLDTCLEGGGYCLGSGNSVANYIPIANYLAMVDEGRLYC